jgi:hypothetical protein
MRRKPDFRHRRHEFRVAGTRRDSLDCELSTPEVKLDSLAGCIWRSISSLYEAS